MHGDRNRSHTYQHMFSVSGFAAIPTCTLISTVMASWLADPLGLCLGGAGAIARSEWMEMCFFLSEVHVFLEAFRGF